ncbi:hypothetical protein NFI96_001266 [Prochilodus magdalenae]|nr:hypothetical protein NFI96_001266 [Prochilodus magdalenae]
MLFEWNHFSVPLWERRKRPTEDHTPVKEAGTLPGDHDYASATDPAAVDLVLEENTLLREEILQLKQQIEKVTLEHRFGIHRFAGSDRDIRFYTRCTIYKVEQQAPAKLPAMSETIITACVSGATAASPVPTDYVGVLIPNPTCKVAVAHTLSEVQNGMTVVRVLNTTEDDIELQPGQHLDHKPLVGLRKIPIDNDRTGRRARWALELDSFEWTVLYREGQKHSNADHVVQM